MAEDRDFLCGNWAWDPVLHELRYYRRGRKGRDADPEAVERLQRVRSVTLHRWSQALMQTHTGTRMPATHARIVAAFEGGGDLTVNEADRDCATKIARAIADAYGLRVIEEGAPTGRRGGNLPQRDTMGRLVTLSDGTEVVLDEAAGEITVTRRKRPFGKSRRTVRTSEIRALELGYEVRVPYEMYTVWAILEGDQEKVPVASYSGYEGWAEPQEWRDFTAELGRSLGAPVVSAGDAA